MVLGAWLQDQLDCVLQVFREFQGPVYHLLGNHCLYNLSRAQLHPKLGLAADVPAYYDFAPHERFRFVMVDPYDISIMGWPEGHPRRAAAERILKQHNPNADMNSPVGLRGYRRRYVAFNGGVRAAHTRRTHAHVCSWMCRVCRLSRVVQRWVMSRWSGWRRCWRTRRPRSNGS
jgi:hypothetical protein